MILQNVLDQFWCTENYHRWSSLFPRMFLSDGADYVAQNGGKQGAFWLMDAIASYQPKLLKNQRLREFQVWTLAVAEDKSAVLTCVADSGEKPVVTQKFDYTDFDFTIKLWVEPCQGGWLILLPSEH